MQKTKKFKRRLGVNIDHIATLREARKSVYPAPVDSLLILRKCRVDQVTIHLREDRRHINDDDLIKIIKAKVLPVNMELAVTAEMVKIALKYKPATCTFVPEKREEITTEGGLDCLKNQGDLAEQIAKIKSKKIHCSLFIDADAEQIQAAKDLGADAIELHTGNYCNLIEEFHKKNGHYGYKQSKEFVKRVNAAQVKLAQGSHLAARLGLKVYAGHGLHTQNLNPIVAIPQIEEYNIGHSIIARSVFVGLEKAIREIQSLLNPK